MSELNHRHELFVSHIHQGFNGRQAYMRTYPKASERTADVQASRLLSSPKVKARLAELQAASAAALKIDLPFLTTGLHTAYLLGLRTNQASAAAQAMMGIAKLHGFIIDKQQVDQVIRKPILDPLSPDEMSESNWLSLNSPVLELEPSQGSASTDQVEPKQPAVETK